jgi:hypothetical protein
MIKISVEVRNGAARFDVMVQAESIQRAVSIVRGRYPGADVKVKFPIHSEEFFAEHSAARAGTDDRNQPDGVAA